MQTAAKYELSNDDYDSFYKLLNKQDQSFSKCNGQKLENVFNTKINTVIEERCIVLHLDQAMLCTVQGHGQSIVFSRCLPNVT